MSPCGGPLPNSKVASRRDRVDAINTRRVSAGRFACFRVVSRRQNRRFCSSARFLRRVRFPAAPPGKGRADQRFSFSSRANINSRIDIDVLGGPLSSNQAASSVGAIGHRSTTPRFSRRREVGVKPETESVRGSFASDGTRRSRCCSIRSSTCSCVMRQVRPTRYPDNSPRFNRRDSHRTPSVIS